MSDCSVATSKSEKSSLGLWVAPFGHRNNCSRWWCFGVRPLREKRRAAIIKACLFQFCDGPQNERATSQTCAITFRLTRKIAESQAYPLNLFFAILFAVLNLLRLHVFWLCTILTSYSSFSTTTRHFLYLYFQLYLLNLTLVQFLAGLLVGFCLQMVRKFILLLALSPPLSGFARVSALGDRLSRLARAYVQLVSSLAWRNDLWPAPLSHSSPPLWLLAPAFAGQPGVCFDSGAEANRTATIRG